MATIKYNNAYIEDWLTIVGPKEAESKLKKIDYKMDDYYFGEKTFEQCEIKMQRLIIDNILNNNNLKKEDINILIGGDLLDQISVSNYAASDNRISMLGIYSACATFAESLIIGSMFLKESSIKNVLTITSSHNKTAERCYRFPIEYGYPKKGVSTCTVTAGITTLLKKDEGKIKIESATIGKVIEKGIVDIFNMGAIMVPSAANTLYEHLKDLKRDVSYYDLILTGDLGCTGAEIFKEYMKKEYNINVSKHIDAGCEIYLKSDEISSGGSGPSALPLILFNKIIFSGKYKKILIIATGSLHSRTLANQKISIPSIAHAVSLEVL